MSAKQKAFSVSHSKMATFRRCLQQFHWKYIDGHYPPSSAGQLRGTCGHAALAIWHVDYDEDKATQAAWDIWESHGFSQNEDWQLLEDSLGRYYPWSREHDKFKLLHAEQEFNIHFDVEGTDVKFNGYIDGIVEENKKLWLLENKFYKRMQNANTLFLDQQVSLYMLASHLLGYEVQGVIYNMVRVADTKIAVTEPVVRQRIYRSSEGLGLIQNEMLQQVGAMLTYVQKGGPTYRTPTKDCTWDCSFYRACLGMTEDGQEPTEELQAVTTKRKLKE